METQQSPQALITRLENVYLDYLAYLQQRQGLLSLRDLLDIDDRFDAFVPHQDRLEVEAEVKAFAVGHHIWHDRAGDIYNTMTAYLHPYTAEPQLLTTIGAVYALLYFMDDYIGNEKQKHLSVEEKQQSYAMLKRLGTYLSFPAHGERAPRSALKSTPIEMASRKIIEAIEEEVLAEDTPERRAWYRRFTAYLLQHLNKAVVEQDGNELLSIEEYIAVRDEVSGMKPAIVLMEFGSRNYIARPRLQELGLLSSIEELELLCIRYGGLVNDLFSFYKEVMEDRTIFNLVSITYLNQAHVDSPTAMMSAIHGVCNLMIDIKNTFFSIEQQVIKQVEQLTVSEPEIAQQALRYVNDLANGMIATWRWQLEAGNLRYARPVDRVIFEEIALSMPVEEWVPLNYQSVQMD